MELEGGRVGAEGRRSGGLRSPHVCPLYAGLAAPPARSAQGITTWAESGSGRLRGQIFNGNYTLM